MRICVVGLGKIGLPLAVQYAGKGHQVVGVDVQQTVVEQVNAATEPFPGETDLAARLAAAVSAGRLRATSSHAEGVAGADAVVMVVPIYVDEQTGQPDYGWMDAATRAVAAALRPGVLVAYETTLPVGTTRGRWKPMIEEVSGLVDGQDLDVVFSPERVLTGRVFADLRRYPKLIGGLTERGAAKARAFYEAVLDFDPRPDLARPNGVWDLGSAEAAELAKLAETTFREVNFRRAQQFARFAATAGIDIRQVIEAANSQPYSHIHRPGIAVGGHCIPVYPRLYLSTDPDATVVSAARAANAAMPGYAVGLLQGALGSLQDAAVVVLGASYRGGVKETAFSGVFPTVAALREAGARVWVHDPLYDADELRRLGLEPYQGQQVDAAILQADHDEYRTWGEQQLPGIRVLVDGRNITDPARWAGVSRLVIGVPGAETPREDRRAGDETRPRESEGR